MIPYKDSYIIGLDLGYGNIKTANICFPTGVTVHDTEPVFKGKTLLYKGTYYKIGESSKPFISDKTADTDFLILAYAGIAAECLANNVTQGNIILAVGIPTSMVKAQREDTRKYLLSDTEPEFDYNSRHFKFHLEKCYIFPQGYPAIYGRNNELSGVSMIADIGNGTMNIIYLSDKKVIEEKCHTEKIGVGQFRIMAHNAIMDNFGKKIDPAVVESFIYGRKTDISEKYISVLEKAAENYCRQLTDTLEKYEYDSDFMKLYVAGGGGALLKRYGKYEPSRTFFINDVCAAAKGFEHFALLKCKAESKVIT